MDVFMFENKGRQRVLELIFCTFSIGRIVSFETIFGKIPLKINRFCLPINFFCIFANSIRGR